jgi:hypothetical protein
MWLRWWGLWRLSWQTVRTALVWLSHRRNTEQNRYNAHKGVYAVGSPKVDAKDTVYRLLFITLFHDCLRDNEYRAAHTLVFRPTFSVCLANCSISTYCLRSVYLSHVSHSWKDSVLDRNLAVSGMHYLISPFNALVTRRFEGAL